MANFAGDLSSAYGCTATLFATSTGVSTNANAAGGSVDLASNVGNIVSAILVSGNAGGTNPTMSLKMQESTDGTNNYTDVTGGAFTQVTTHNKVEVIAFKPTKQYVRCTGTVDGTNPVFEVQVLVGPYPLRTAPANDGGFDMTVAAGN